MAYHNNEFDLLDVSDLPSYGSESEDSKNQPESQLCIPEDRLEDLELFPNFVDDFISVSDFLELPEAGDKERFAMEKHSSGGFDDERKRGIIEGGIGILEGFGNKKQRSKRLLPSGNKRVVAVKKRRCSHCQTEDTPQWRMGPTGPNTLCNACGVRYKSGRLVPEYRPASSPGFDALKHSNFHRKILQRRVMNV